ncbi:MAG: hypothetical protein ABDI19_09880 [Armatimonadota bacterium]
MRAIKGRAEGTIVRLLEPVPEPIDQEVIVLIPTRPDEQKLDILLFAGILADMPDEEWQALRHALAQGVQVGEEPK